MRYVPSLAFKSILMQFLFVFLAANTAFADNYTEVIDDFFSHYEKGEITKAFDGLYATNKWIDAESDSILRLKSDIKSMHNMVGDYLGKKKMGEYSFGEFLIQTYYAVLYERQPVMMGFTFYYTGEKWVVYNFTFNTDIDQKLQEHALSNLFEQAR